MRSSLLLIRRLNIETGSLEKLIEYYKSGNLSHAYLISTNNTNKCLDVLLNVIKNIFCSEFQEDCKKCSLCHLIDINNLPSLKIIEPEGSFIKKEQIIELKKFFSKDSQYTKENIYIIKSAEKMNKESANTLLKFLEEPDGSVIGFFITNHIDNVLLTIQSRCQHLEVLFQNDDYEKINLTKEKYDEFSEVIKKYLYDLEINRKELILYNKQHLVGYEKKDIISIFQIILDIYVNLLSQNYTDIKLEDYEFLKNLKPLNIQKKINIIVELLKEINYNINLDLLLDRFVIEMDGVNNESI